MRGRRREILAVARWQTGRWRLVAEAGCGGHIPSLSVRGQVASVAAGGGGVWLLVTLSLATAQLRGQFFSKCYMILDIDCYILEWLQSSFMVL